MIALSIVFVAAEIVRGLRGQSSLTAQAPWVVAFSFGLLDGFGFAGALAEIGLPQRAIPVALLTFNVGVEIGQLLFVAIALGIRAVQARLPVRGAPGCRTHFHMQSALSRCSGRSNEWWRFSEVSLLTLVHRAKRHGVSECLARSSCWQLVVAIFGASAFPTSSGHFLEAAPLVPLTLLVSDSSSEQAQTFAAH